MKQNKNLSDYLHQKAELYCVIKQSIPPLWCSSH